LIAQHCKLMAQKSKHAEKLAAIKAQTQGSYASGEEAGARDENVGGKRKYRKNDISGIQQEELELFAGETLFFYQQYLRANKHHAIRNILKSRQIGATWYFAFEAL
ncbi:terminase, partial [Yersinia enterocolitica]